MDIETKIALGFLICFVAGLIVGWYVMESKNGTQEEGNEQ